MSEIGSINLSNRMTPIKTKSPSSLKLGDPISENFEGKSMENSSNLGPQKPNYILYILLIILLAVLGINIFAYLGILSDNLIGFFRPVIIDFVYYSSETIRSTVDTSAEGSKLGIDVAAGTVTSAIDLGQKAGGKTPDDEELEETVINDNKLKQSINDKNVKKNSKKVNNTPVVPDDVDSLMQQSKPAKEAGFCYIGEDRGFRSCIEVTDKDVCMSGDIFPSQEICVNPSLREGSEKVRPRDFMPKN